MASPMHTPILFAQHGNYGHGHGHVSFALEIVLASLSEFSSAS